MKISVRTIENATILDNNASIIFQGDLEFYDAEQLGEKFQVFQSNKPRLLGAGVISETLSNRVCPVNHNELLLTEPCPECGK